jgi:hypothetical protein
LCVLGATLLIFNLIVAAAGDYGGVHSRRATIIFTVCNWSPTPATWWLGSIEPQAHNCAEGKFTMRISIEILKVVLLKHLWTLIHHG